MPWPPVMTAPPELLFERIIAVIDGKQHYRMIHCEGLIVHSEAIFEDDT